MTLIGGRKLIRRYLGLFAIVVLIAFAPVNLSVAAEMSAGQTTVDPHAKHRVMLQAKPNYQRTEQVYQILNDSGIQSFYLYLFPSLGSRH